MRFALSHPRYLPYFCLKGVTADGTHFMFNNLIDGNYNAYIVARSLSKVLRLMALFFIVLR